MAGVIIPPAQRASVELPMPWYQSPQSAKKIVPIQNGHQDQQKSKNGFKIFCIICAIITVILIILIIVLVLIFTTGGQHKIPCNSPPLSSKGQ